MNSQQKACSKQAFDVSHFEPLAILCLVALAAAMLAFNPYGYRGGGGDDWHYLEAARCIAELGYCEPATHWGSRYPLVIPLGALIAQFGESRLGLAIPTLLAASATCAMLYHLVRSRFGTWSAALSTGFVILTPEFADRALRPNVDMLELGWLAAAVFCLQQFHDNPRRRFWLCASGIAAGIAIGARETALASVLVIAIGWIALSGWPKKGALVLWLASIAAPSVVEGLLSEYFFGDAFLRWKLALGHTGIPSTSIDPALWGASPIFNPEVIAGWHKVSGISVHWTVDGLLNLAVAPSISLSLAAASFCFLALTLRRGKLASPREYGVATLSLAGAALYFSLLTYALAVHPTPRMFLPVIALLAVAFGLSARALWGDGPAAITIVIAAIFVVRGFSVQHAAPNLWELDRLASKVADQTSAPYSSDPWTLRVLTLNPSFRPIEPRSEGPRQSIRIGVQGCETLLAGMRQRDPSWRLARVEPVRKNDIAPVRWLRSSGILLGRQPLIEVCLLKRNSAIQRGQTG